MNIKLVLRIKYFLLHSTYIFFLYVRNEKNTNENPLSNADHNNDDSGLVDVDVSIQFCGEKSEGHIVT